jgi:hypothetical protein
MENFILSILPYLKVKRAQAMVALDFVRLHGQEVPEKREKLRHQMLVLNNSGKSKDFNSKSVETITQDVSDDTMIESVLIGDNESTPVGTLAV